MSDFLDHHYELHGGYWGADHEDAAVRCVSGKKWQTLSSDTLNCPVNMVAMNGGSQWSEI